MKTIKALFVQYREIILYLIFGVLTTVVNWASYFACTDLLHIDYMVSTAIAWLLSVLFAYATNRRWVFDSPVTGVKPILLEALSFFGGRGFSGLVELGGMKLLVDVFSVNDKIAKIGLSVLVVILNYVLSKLLIFRKKRAQ